MHTDPAIAAAHIALDTILDGVLAHPDTYQRRDGASIAQDCIAALRAALDAPTPNHPDYVPMARTTAALIALFVQQPQTWRAMVADALPKGDAPTDTLQGLVALANLVRLIGDDHDLALDPASATPRLAAQESLPPATPSATPRSLLAVLLPLVGA